MITPGPLHLLFPLPPKQLCQISVFLSLLFRSNRCSNIILSPLLHRAFSDLSKADTIVPQQFLDPSLVLSFSITTYYNLGDIFHCFFLLLFPLTKHNLNEESLSFSSLLYPRHPENPVTMKAPGTQTVISKVTSH